MRVIIAGSRAIRDTYREPYGSVPKIHTENLHLVTEAVLESGFLITEGVVGGAPGVDRLGEIVLRGMRDPQTANNIPVRVFRPEWRRRDGSFNPRAGFERNEAMAVFAKLGTGKHAGGGLVAVWDGESHGTYDMIDRALKHDLRVHVKIVEV